MSTATFTSSNGHAPKAAGTRAARVAAVVSSGVLTPPRFDGGAAKAEARKAESLRHVSASVPAVGFFAKVGGFFAGVARTAVGAVKAVGRFVVKAARAVWAWNIKGRDAVRRFVVLVGRGVRAVAVGFVRGVRNILAGFIRVVAAVLGFVLKVLIALVIGVISAAAAFAEGVRVVWSNEYLDYDFDELVAV